MGTCRKTGSCDWTAAKPAIACTSWPPLEPSVEDQWRSRQDNNGSAILWVGEVSIYRFEFIAIAQPPVLNSYPMLICCETI
jgi:hypothetical protein